MLHQHLEKMSGGSKVSHPGSSPKTAPTKGKRKTFHDPHGNPTPGPSNPPGTTSCFPGTGRQYPNLAPKPVIIDPDLVEHEPLQQCKRPRVDHELQTPAWSHGTILGIDTHLGGSSNPVAKPIQTSQFGLQTPATFFDSFPFLQNTSQAETAPLLSLAQPPPVTTIAENFQMPAAQPPAVGCCPQCQAMLKSLRESIIAITCGQGLSSGGGSMGEKLWKSYFGLEDHWIEDHVPGVGLAD